MRALAHIVRESPEAMSLAIGAKRHISNVFCSKIIDFPQA
jgi:hypothetical protein